MAHGDGPLTAVTMASRSGGRRLALLGALPLLFVVVMFAWPFVALANRAFGDGSSSNLFDLLSGANAAHLLWFTIVQAAGSTVLTLVLGIPVAWVLSTYELPGALIFRVIVTIPFVLPTVVVGWPSRRSSATADRWGSRGSGRRSGRSCCAHVLQRRGGGPHGRVGAVAIGSPRRAGGAHARRRSVARLSGRDAARAVDGDRVGGDGGLPVLRHQFRGGVDPGRRPLQHPGNGSPITVVDDA